MPLPTFAELIERASAQEVNSLYGTQLAGLDTKEKVAKLQQFERSERVLTELLTFGRRSGSVPTVNLNEAVHSDDFKILFPKVIQSILQRPKEANYIGQTVLARTLNVDNANRVIEFNTLGPIRVFELAENQEAKEQDPSFGKEITEFRIKRYGAKLEFALDVIENSQWDIVALQVENMNNALKRKKEELVFLQYEARAVTMFDNSLSNPDFWTSGLASNGLDKNATFGHDDLMDMMAALAGMDYNPTDVIVHPLAWAIWGKDPTLRFQMLHQGGIGQNIGQFSGMGEDMSGEQWMPFGLNTVVTPFQTRNLNANPNTGCATGGTFNYTTITVLDRQEGIVIMQKSPPRIVEWENPARDIRSMQFDERYCVDLVNGGRSAVVAKNVKIATNFAPVYAIRTYTSS